MQLRTRRRNLLIVDDDIHIAKATARVLQRSFDAGIAIGARDALRQIPGRVLDVVLLGFDLEGLSAVQLLTWIADSFPAVHRLVTSWWPATDAERVPRGLAHGVLKKLPTV